MTESNSSLSSAWSELLSFSGSFPGWVCPNALQSSTPSWYSRWKACLDSRFMAHSLGLSRLSVRVLYLLAALVYIGASLTSDYEYAVGLRTKEATAFILSSNLFPLVRERRSAPGYLAMVQSDHVHIDWIEQALRFDPNAAHLWLGLIVMRLQEGNQAAANAAAAHLLPLLPRGTQ